MSRPLGAVIAAIIGLHPALCLAQPEPGEASEEPRDDAEPPEEDEPETGPDGEPLPGQSPAAKEKRPHIEEPDEDEGPEPPLIVPAPDQLTGHFSLSASALLAFPFGYLEADRAQTDFMGSGYGFGADAAFGISRFVALGAWGQLLRLGDSDSCRKCETQTTAAGVFVRYHLIQGMRFDPWMSAGIGFRQIKISEPSGADTTYSGIEWLRLQVGGDWYAFKNVGFGPLMELDMGRYSTRSPSGMGDSANHWMFLMGARVTLDIPGK